MLVFLAFRLRRSHSPAGSRLCQGFAAVHQLRGGHDAGFEIYFCFEHWEVKLKILQNFIPTQMYVFLLGIMFRSVFGRTAAFPEDLLLWAVLTCTRSSV